MCVNGSSKRRLRCVAVVCATFFLLRVLAAQALPAFPGAEGFGSQTVGGRGGTVYTVTTLAASGPGSLREALEAEGPRIVVFNAAGVIDLGTDDIVITHPYLTLAGQTAPGKGVVIKNAGIEIATHDIVIRGMRVRVGGSLEGANPRYRDGIRISAEGCDTRTQACVEPYNVVLDHNSISWAVDENLSIWGAARDITLSWNIISEGLNCSIHRDGCHSMGLLVGPEVHNISVHHNFMAHHTDRSPHLYTGFSGELVNNVFYDWGWAATHLGGCDHAPEAPSRINMIGNYYRAGPSTYAFADDGNTINNAILFEGCWRNAAVYLRDNLGPQRGGEELVSDWALASNGSLPGERSDAPVLPLSDVSVLPVNDTLDQVLATVGAIAPQRDAVDQRVIDQFQAYSGGLIDSERDVEAWDDYASVSLSYTDTDQDGMPDVYERSVGLNPNDPSDTHDIAAGELYGNIERYLDYRMYNALPTEGATPGEEPPMAPSEDVPAELPDETPPVSGDNPDETAGTIPHFRSGKYDIIALALLLGIICIKVCIYRRKRRKKS